MRGLAVGVVVMMLGGCGTSGKMKKAYDEGYARGHGEGRLDEFMNTPEGESVKLLRQCNDRLSNCLASNNELRSRLESCLDGDRQK